MALDVNAKRGMRAVATRAGRKTAGECRHSNSRASESSEVFDSCCAAGICHSDAHYRAGISEIDRLPLTLGHEVRGRVEKS